MDDRLFTEREEEEQGKEFEEEAEEDYEYLDYDYDAFEEVDFRITKPEVTTWAGCDGKSLEGLLVDWPILGRSKNIPVFNDVCPICFKALTGSGKHQICCLPCGHIYGSSCIDQWLQKSEGYRKCPQCKSLCMLKDVTLLHATRPGDARYALPKGFKAFKRYALRRLDDESGMRLDAMRRRDYARHQRKQKILRRRDMYSMVPLDKFYRLTDRLVWREHSLIRRTGALEMRIDKYHEGIHLFVQRYKEHMTQDTNECKVIATTANPITISIHGTVPISE